VNCDLAVVGGGPAGLAAAREVAQRGGSVVLFDENPTLGGKLLGQLHEERSGAWWKGWEVAARLVGEAQSAGVRAYTGASVWGLEPGWTTHVAYPHGPASGPGRVTAKAVVVATGAMEKTLPLPGWTLPGVMTVGAAQVLMNVYRVLPGLRAVVVGIDPLALSVARQLKLAGAEVLAVVPPARHRLSTPLGEPEHVLSMLGAMSKAAPNLAQRLAGSLLRSKAGRCIATRTPMPESFDVWGIPLRLRTPLERVEGDGQVEAVVLGRRGANGEKRGPETTLAVDVVCLSGGLTPFADLLAAAGVLFTNAPALGGAVPRHGPAGKTQSTGLYVAGSAGGVEGADVAAAQGRAAGIAVAMELGLVPSSSNELGDALRAEAAARATAKLEFYPGAAAARQLLASGWAVSG